MNYSTGKGIWLTNNTFYWCHWTYSSQPYLCVLKHLAWIGQDWFQWLCKQSHHNSHVCSMWSSLHHIFIVFYYHTPFKWNLARHKCMSNNALWQYYIAVTRQNGHSIGYTPISWELLYHISYNPGEQTNSAGNVGINNWLHMILINSAGNVGKNDWLHRYLAD